MKVVFSHSVHPRAFQKLLSIPTRRWSRLPFTLDQRPHGLRSLLSRFESLAAFQAKRLVPWRNQPAKGTHPLRADFPAPRYQYRKQLPAQIRNKG